MITNRTCCESLSIAFCLWAEAKSLYFHQHCETCTVTSIFDYADKWKSNWNTRMKQEGTPWSGNNLTFLFVPASPSFPDFSSESPMATEKRAALERRACLWTTATPSFGRQEVAGWGTQKYPGVLFCWPHSLPYIPFFFLITLHDNLIKTQTSKNQHGEY